jgi:hypothetical protein
VIECTTAFVAGKPAMIPPVDYDPVSDGEVWCEILADCVETLFAAASRLEGRFLGRVVFVEKGLSNSVTPGNVLT